MSARAAARAANEQDDEAAPNKVEREMLLKFAEPMKFVSFPLGTKAWIIPDTKYPSTNAHPAFQKKPRAVLDDSPNNWIKDSMVPDLFYRFDHASLETDLLNFLTTYYAI
jgi:hypothetical protein